MPFYFHAKTPLSAEKFFFRCCYYFLCLCFPYPQTAFFWRATHFHMSWLHRRQISFFQVCLRQVCFFLLLSHLFSTFHSCCSLCVPMLPHWPIPPSQCRVWELSPLKQIFPSLKSLGALSLQGPGNKVYSGPRPAGVQEAKLPFQVQRRSHH